MSASGVSIGTGPGPYLRENLINLSRMRKYFNWCVHSYGMEENAVEGNVMNSNLTLSGEVIREKGYTWVGLSQAMLVCQPRNWGMKTTVGSAFCAICNEVRSVRHRGIRRK